MGPYHLQVVTKLVPFVTTVVLLTRDSVNVPCDIFQVRFSQGKVFFFFEATTAKYSLMNITIPSPNAFSGNVHK